MKNKFKVGSYNWSNTTDTSLSFKEKIQLFGQLIASQIIDIGNAAGNKYGFNHSKLARVDSQRIIMPDSKIAKESLERANDIYDLPLFNHCLRTYLWGVLVGQYHGMQPDLEFLYIGGLLHDSGLSQANQSKICSCCFAVTGARDAQTFVEERGWKSDRSTALYNAISMHLNPLVSKADGLEGFLIKSGAYMDLLGVGHTRIPMKDKIKIIQDYPRLKFNEDILNVKHFPDSRGDYFAKFGAIELSRKNPLNKLEHIAAQVR